MSKLPVCNAKDVARVLNQQGFQCIKQRGSHQKWRHQDGRQVIVPFHGSKPIPIGTLKSILDASGIDVDEFR